MLVAWSPIRSMFLAMKEQVRARRDAARVLHHVGEQLAEEAVVGFVDILVAPPHRHGALHVAVAEGIEHVLDHALRDARHARDRVGEADGIDLVDGDGALGDVGRVVAHALEVARHLERRGDDPQVHRHRLAQREDAHRELVDLGLQRVHPPVVGDHLRGGTVVAADQRGDGGGKLLLDDAAHLQDRVVHAIQLLVVGLDRVLGSHGSRLPVLSPARA